MTNSHLLGFITFGTAALFSLLAWVLSNKHPGIAHNRALRLRTRRTALWVLVGGAVFGYVAFLIDNDNRITTLHEVMIEGSAGTTAGSPAPLRTITFTVEHPGVEHKLLLHPTADLFQKPDFDVDISFAMRGPQREILLPESSERFAVDEGSSRNRTDWEGKTFSFKPSVAGVHTLWLRPLTVGVPRIHVRIEDPQKRNGERMPGY